MQLIWDQCTSGVTTIQSPIMVKKEKEKPEIFPLFL